ncbi:hypothetical protein R1flu_023370 [Riccia fluitans]|uniref:Uncharacterized protein n=1 Tax=Riccia fluitans TaxID=41844 RepID=A0ABD1XRW0_9MARC
MRKDKQTTPAGRLSSWITKCGMRSGALGHYEGFAMQTLKGAARTPGVPSPVLGRQGRRSPRFVLYTNNHCPSSEPVNAHGPHVVASISECVDALIQRTRYESVSGLADLYSKPYLGHSRRGARWWCTHNQHLAWIGERGATFTEVPYLAWPYRASGMVASDRVEALEFTHRGTAEHRGCRIDPWPIRFGKNHRHGRQLRDFLGQGTAPIDAKEC